MIKNITRGLLASAFALVLAAVPARAGGDEVVYTRVGMSYEKNHHLTTNYFKGTRVPINTKVMIKDKGKNSIEIVLMDSSKTGIDIKNVEKHTKVPIDTIYARYFSKEPTPESELSAAFLQDIKDGKITVGMTKKDVIASVGYPPGHKTPSLDGDSWQYWANRFDTKLVIFKDGKVVEVKT